MMQGVMSARDNASKVVRGTHPSLGAGGLGCGAEETNCRGGEGQGVDRNGFTGVENSDRGDLGDACPLSAHFWGASPLPSHTPLGWAGAPPRGGRGART